jgi:hypothetical protein
VEKSDGIPRRRIEPIIDLTTDAHHIAHSEIRQAERDRINYEIWHDTDSSLRSSENRPCFLGSHKHLIRLEEIAIFGHFMGDATDRAFENGWADTPLTRRDPRAGWLNPGGKDRPQPLRPHKTPANARETGVKGLP